MNNSLHKQCTIGINYYNVHIPIHVLLILSSTATIRVNVLACTHVQVLYIRYAMLEHNKPMKNI